MDEDLRRLIALGREHFQAHDWDAAEEALTSALARAPGLADVWSMLGVIRHGQGRLADAEQAFEEALRLNPAYTEAALNLAITYNDLGKYALARDVYARAMQRTRAAPRALDPYVKGKLANLHADLAEAYAAHGLLPEALREYRSALELCPTFGDLRTRLALLLRDAGDRTGALRELELTRTTQPRYVPARLALGLTLQQAGRQEEALREWEAALAIEPDNQHAGLYLRMARAPHAPAGPAETVALAPDAPAASETTLNDILEGIRAFNDGDDPDGGGAHGGGGPSPS